MADVFDKDKRSEVMSRIRSTGTKPEEQLAEFVRDALGPRWRIDRNRSDLPGKPDIVIPSLGLILELDGCFFHQCPRHGRIPDSNREYWQPKLERNVRRDRRNRRRLRAAGWSVWRFWEHDLKSAAARERTVRRVGRAVRTARAASIG